MIPVTRLLFYVELDGVAAGLAGSDPYCLFQGDDKYFPIADSAGFCGVLDGIDNFGD